MTNFGRNRTGVIWAIGYGVLTELVQPFLIGMPEFWICLLMRLVYV